MYVMLVVIVGWVIFRIENFDRLFLYLKVMFGFFKTDWVQFHVGYYADKRSVFILCVAIILSYGVNHMVKKELCAHHITEQIMEIGKNIVTVLLFLICIIAMANGAYNPFIYFKF